MTRRIAPALQCVVGAGAVASGVAVALGVDISTQAFRALVLVVIGNILLASPGGEGGE